MEDLSKNPEIQSALKEFEVKNAEQPTVNQPLEQKDETPKMIGWVMKYSGGIVTEERQAEYVLLGLVLVAVIASIALFFKTRPNTAPPPLTPLIEQAGSPADFLP